MYEQRGIYSCALGEWKNTHTIFPYITHTATNNTKIPIWILSPMYACTNTMKMNKKSQFESAHAAVIKCLQVLYKKSALILVPYAD